MVQLSLESELLRLSIDQNNDFTAEEIELKDGSTLIPIIGSHRRESTLLFCNKGKISSNALKMKTQSEKALVLQLNNQEIYMKLEITLLKPDLLHFKYYMKPNTRLKLSKLIANYNILLGSEPSFTWVPHIRPKENFVIGDHVFRSPAIIYSKDHYSFALIPDLDILGESRPTQAIMDLNLQITEGRQFPQIYYGFGKYKTTEHVFFKHNPKKRFQIQKGAELSMGYYIKVFKDAPVAAVLESVNTLLWDMYGHELLTRDLNPQILPYRINVEEGFKAIFERQKCWNNFTLNDAPCGGSFQGSWLGKRKKRYKFITPEKAEKHKSGNFSQRIEPDSILGRIIWYFANSIWWLKRFAWFTSHFAIMKRVAEVWYNAWFMNIRTGYAFRYFGEVWDDEALMDKGNRTLNTVLNLPRIRGVFPSVVFPETWDATEYCTINGLFAFRYTNLFNLVDTSLAMYWALKFYQDFEPREEIKSKCRDLVDLFEDIQLENGAIPIYLSFDEDNHTPIINDTLIDSASTAAPLMFLTEYYKVSQDPRIIPMAEKMAQYLQRDIIPADKWHDFEPFFSCTNFPLDIYCHYTQSHVMNGLCIYWTAEGLKELYKITQKDEYLHSGERVMAILNLFQQVWNPPYISFNAFGGFCSQNADAELSDARQGLFVRVYMEYYLLTGKIEYMERAIAILRACWAVQLLKEYELQCSGNLVGLSQLDGVDRGAVFENYGHLGNDYRVPGYIFPDWGIGSSASATAYVKKHFGDLFLDFKFQKAFGIDGIIVQSAEFSGNRAILSILTMANKGKTIIKARKVPADHIELFINNRSLGLIERAVLEAGFEFEL